MAGEFGHALILVVSSAAGKFSRKSGELSFQKRLHCQAHGGIIAREKDFDAVLHKSHERTHAHAAGKQLGHSMRSQMLNRSETPPLLVGDIGQSGYGLNGPILDVDDGVNVAVSKVHAHSGIQSAGIGRRNR